MTYLYQIHPDLEEAEMMGGLCSLVIVEADHFNATGALADDHILDTLIAQTNDPTLGDTLDEIAESMFVSQLDPEETRAYLAGLGLFQEQTLFNLS